MNFDQIPSPAYVIDENKLTANLELISNVAKKAGVEIIVALKAFAGWRMFPLMNKRWCSKWLTGSTSYTR